MLDISITKLLVVFVIAVCVVGPKRLPELAHFIGRCLRHFRQIRNSLTMEFTRQDAQSPRQEQAKLEQDHSQGG